MSTSRSSDWMSSPSATSRSRASPSSICSRSCTAARRRRSAMRKHDRPDQEWERDGGRHDEDADSHALADVVGELIRPRGGRRRRRRCVQVTLGARVDLGDAVDRGEQLGVEPLVAVGLHGRPDRGRRGLDHRMRGHDMEVRTVRDEQRAAPARHRLVDRVGERTHPAGAIGALLRHDRDLNPPDVRVHDPQAQLAALRHREQAALRLVDEHRIGPERGRHLARGRGRKRA